MAENNGILKSSCGKICDDTIAPSTAPDAALGEATTIATSSNPNTAQQSLTLF